MQKSNKTEEMVPMSKHREIVEQLYKIKDDEAARCKKERKRENRNKLMIGLVIGGIVGAQIVYSLMSPRSYEVVMRTHNSIKGHIYDICDSAYLGIPKYTDSGKEKYYTMRECEASLDEHGCDYLYNYLGGTGNLVTCDFDYQT